MKIKRKEGKYVLPQVPYGYLRSAEDKYKLIPDEDVQHIIENIFMMYLNGNSLSDIARSLESRHILPPSQHKRKRKGQEINPNVVWRSHMIKMILSQDILTGHMVQGKTASYSHKVKKRIPLPKDKWIIVKNTHKAIIDEDTFSQVQALLSKETRPKTSVKSKTTPSILAGFIVCADCNKQMQRTKTTKDGKVHYYFRCRTNKQLGSLECSSHLISEKVITEILLASINSLIDGFIDVEAAVRKNENNEILLMKKRVKHQLEKAISENDRLANTRAQLYHTYINRLDDMLTDEVYVNMRNSYEQMNKANDEKVASLKQELDNLENNQGYETDFMQDYGKYKSISELTRNVVADLVDKIIIREDKSIKIIFKFQDEIAKYSQFFEQNICTKAVL